MIKEKYKNIILTIFSISISILLLEVFITIFYNNDSDLKKKRYLVAKKQNINFDKRSRIEFFNHIDGNDNKVIFHGIYDKAFIKKNNENLVYWNLGQVSNTLTVHCNEIGYMNTYISDRYGFNNKDFLWDKKIENILIGNSFVHGACVKNEKNISSNINSYGKSTLSFGLGGTGPLHQLAILKEYYKLTRPKNVIYFYYEDNDLKDLARSITDVNLIKYLKPNFIQNIANHQKEIDEHLTIEFKKILNTDPGKLGNSTIDVTQKKKINFTKNLIKILRLTELRKFINFFLNESFYLNKSNIDELSVLNDYKDIIIEMERYTRTSGSNFIIVYIPSYQTFHYPFYDYKIKKDLKYFFSTNYNFIDLEKEIKKKFKDPKKVYPYELYGHFNELGYQFISEVIFRNIK